MSATTVLVAALARLTQVRVSTHLPEVKPERFIVVSRIGGGASDWAIRTSRFLVECYACSEVAAEELAEQVWEAWPALRDERSIMWAARDNNVVRYDDPDPTLFRFQFTAGVQLRPR